VEWALFLVLGWYFEQVRFGVGLVLVLWVWVCVRVCVCVRACVQQALPGSMLCMYHVHACCPCAMCCVVCCCLCHVLDVVGVLSSFANNTTTLPNN
jgi:hypothetical protein